MIKPNYIDGSILNLLTSIGKSFGAYSSIYKPLKLLPPSQLKKSKNILLLIVDGLGYEYVTNNLKNTILSKNLNRKITSTFPSSTSAAMTSLYLGISPKEHGMTGWEMFMKELGTTIIPLPYIDKLNKSPLPEEVKINELFNLKPFANRIKAKSYKIMPKKIQDSRFTIAASGKTKLLGYNSLSGMFKQIYKTIKINNNNKKFILTYWPDHDSLAHKIGIDNNKVLKQLKKFNKKLESFLKSIKNTTIIITADHGQIQIPKDKLIILNKHPKLVETLSTPITGEHRFAYAYIKPRKEKQFKNYIKTKLSHACKIYKSQDLVKKNFFGLGKSHPHLLDRIGDYTIIMNENYAIYQYPPHHKKHKYNIGDHGGLSKEEMFVPLIVINK